MRYIATTDGKLEDLHLTDKTTAIDYIDGKERHKKITYGYVDPTLAFGGLADSFLNGKSLLYKIIYSSGRIERKLDILKEESTIAKTFSIILRPATFTHWELVNEDSNSVFGSFNLPFPNTYSLNPEVNVKTGPDRKIVSITCGGCPKRK